MFTGIVTYCGRVAKVEETSLARKIWFATSFTDLQLGESIALDGVCLTVAEINGQEFRCDVSPETLRLTTASSWQLGTKVNQERALRPVDRIGGHFVSGHVDQLGCVENRTEHADYLELTITDVLAENLPMLIKKGSITVNGVSLTVNAVTANGFTVMLIPHTQQSTNLATLKINDKVNLEFDLLAKYIINLIKQREIA